MIMIKPIGKTILLDVSTGSASTSLTSTSGQPINGVLVSNLSTGVVAYATVSVSSATVIAPTTSTAQNVVPVLGLTQAEIGLQAATTPSTVWVNAIASGSGTVALTPLF
jgi:hypothetical protein